MDTKRICPSCQKPLAPDGPLGLCPECLIQAGFPSGVAPTDEAAGRAAFVPPTVAEIAPLFPQLEILELIGKGGMGAVYKARQIKLNRLVALKILPPGIGSEPAFAARFTREAQALARLNHPGIVTLYEFGRAELPLGLGDGAAQQHRPTDAGLYFFLMEYVDGVNLRQLLQASRISAHEALAIVPQICDALQLAHDQGIVHRDIKPENILMDRRGRVKVADFGLAKIIEGRDAPLGRPDRSSQRDDPTLTDASRVMGTPQYMSPEQIQAPGEVDHRADIYALGVVFYQMLTGELPGKRLEAPSTKVQIDVRLDAVVLRALEKQPELRYQQVSEVKTMVETITATPPGSSGRESAQTESQSRFTSAATNHEPRFSRTAIVGACWAAAFFLFYLVKFLVLYDVRYLPSWLEVLLLTLPIAGFTAPLGATILGWLAVSQIRRSAGKLHGLWLAVFDGLLFPLLIVDGIIVSPFILWPQVLGFTLHGSLTSPFGPIVLLLIPVALVFIVLIDSFMIRRVWRAVHTPGSSRGDEAQTEHEGRKASRLYWSVLAGGVLLCILIAITPRFLWPAYLVWKIDHLNPADANITVKGTVTDAATGKPLPDAVVSDYFFIMPEGARRKTEHHTDSEGRFEFRTWNLGCYGHHYINVMVGGYWCYANSYPVQLTDGNHEVMMNFPLRPDNQSQAAPATSTAPAAAPTLAFGPVVERVVTAFDDNPAQACLDFRTGEFCPPPAALTESLRQLANQQFGTAFTNLNGPGDPIYDWLKTSGVDVLGSHYPDGRAGFKYLGQPPHYQNGWTGFDSVTAGAVMQALQSSPFFAGDQPNLPDVYINAMILDKATQQVSYIVFRTHDGDVGIMKVLGASQNPRGIRIRYKLVENSVTTIMPVSLPTAKPAVPAAHLFRTYPVNRSFAELAQLANTNTPEGCVARFAIGLVGSDPTAAMNRYVIDSPRLPAGAVTVTMTEENRAWVRQIKPRGIMVYREELAAVFVPQQTNQALATAIWGKRQGEWKLCSKADLPEAPTLAAAEKNFRDRAPELYDTFQALPDDPSSLVAETSKQLASNMTEMMGAMMNSMTQLVSQVPGMKTPFQNAGQQITVTASLPESAEEPGVYIVQRGDSLARIAQRHHVPIAQLKELNPGLDSMHLKIGQKLIVSPPVAAENEALRLTNLAKDLKVRISAAAGMTSFMDKDAALAAIAQDAARAGDVEDTRTAVTKMTSFMSRDEAICASARLLAAGGRRADALELAKLITSFMTRDSLVAELAK